MLLFKLSKLYSVASSLEHLRPILIGINKQDIFELHICMIFFCLLSETSMHPYYYSDRTSHSKHKIKILPLTNIDSFFRMLNKKLYYR